LIWAIAMSLNFSGKNLSGRSFKGQDLTGADFSNANIRGADFTHAILKNVNFSHAQAGLSHRWQIVLAAIAIFILALAAFAAWMGGVVAIETIFPSEPLDSRVPHVKNGVPALIVFSVLAVFYGVLLRQGFATALIRATTATGGVVTVLGFAIALMFGGAGLEAVGTGMWRAVAALNWALLGTSFAALSLLMTRFSPWTYTLSLMESIAGVGAITFAFGLFRAANTEPTAMSWPALPLTIAAMGVIFLSGIYAGCKAFDEDKQFLGIRKVAIDLFTLHGTCFRDADLTNANFSQATLNNADFRNAIPICTNFHLVKYLDRARVENTLLMDKTVRELLVAHRGSHQSYQGRNLKGAYLAGADLSDADLTDADISQATLEGAWLDRTNLTRVQAVGTNFCRASLTGACLETWNIDNTTQLEGIVCEFVYLLHALQERRPSSGIFAPGEFTQLFQVALHTVDLIFQHGVDWKAFAISLHQVQIENSGTSLSIQSIENKGAGVVVIKVESSETANKAKLHADFTQAYKMALNTLEQHYRAQLNSKDEQIALHQQHQADLKELVQLLANKAVQIPSISATVKVITGKRVIVKLEQGDLSTGFSVSLQIGKEGELPSVECMGKLDAAPELLTYSHQWQSAYRQGLAECRIEVAETQVTNVGRHEFFQDCYQAAAQLKHHLNLWLNAESFRPVKEQLLEQLNPSESIRFILQTGDRQIQQLPFHLWDFFDRYRKAELALSMPTYEQIERSRSIGAKVRILAILGDSTGINVNSDRHLLEQLPDTEVTFLVEPQRQTLNDRLWAQPWDILFFAGHSASRSEPAESPDSPGSGYIQINKTERLSLLQLKHALRKATEQGLKLAILNSCDGMGLAMDLAHLHIPQMVVMREPVPDRVAQEFLKNFLTAFSCDYPFYQSVREAREKLQGIEDRFPCATWLPLIYQNPSEAPLTWQMLLDA
jgi:uncharacterized protein YjbI with pentapeptide repeats